MPAAARDANGLVRRGGKGNRILRKEGRLPRDRVGASRPMGTRLQKLDPASAA